MAKANGRGTSTATCKQRKQQLVYEEAQVDAFWAKTDEKTRRSDSPFDEPHCMLTVMLDKKVPYRF